MKEQSISMEIIRENCAAFVEGCMSLMRFTTTSFFRTLLIAQLILTSVTACGATERPSTAKQVDTNADVGTGRPSRTPENAPPVSLGPIDAFIVSPHGTYTAVLRRELDSKRRFRVEVFDNKKIMSIDTFVAPLSNLAIDDGGNFILWGAKPTMGRAAMSMVYVYMRLPSGSWNVSVLGETFSMNTQVSWLPGDRIAILTETIYEPSTRLYQGCLRVLDARTGTTRWTRELKHVPPAAFLYPLEVKAGHLRFRSSMDFDHDRRRVIEEVDIETGETLSTVPEW